MLDLQVRLMSNHLTSAHSAFRYKNWNRIALTSQEQTFLKTYLTRIIEELFLSPTAAKIQ